jgi:hypothetical protein
VKLPQIRSILAENVFSDRFQIRHGRTRFVFGYGGSSTTYDVRISVLPIPTPDVPKVGILCGVSPPEVRQPVPSGHTTGTLHEEGA